MAGIGFRLQKLLSGEDYTSTVKAFGFSTLITAGPFLLTVLLVVFVQNLSYDNLTDRGLAYLQSLITYGYAFSLLTVGPSYLVLTRYVADEYYRGHVTSFVASFFSAYVINLAVWSPFVLWFFSGLAVDWGMRLNAFLLYALAVGMWLAMIFLSAAQNYWLVSRAFLLGAAVSLPAAFTLGRAQGLSGYFAGFVLGQAVVLVTLVGAMLKEFGYWEPRDHNWLSYFKLHPRLAGIGFFYNLGIWIDKFQFWASSEGEWLDPRLRYAPIYDTPMFVSYMTILPALVYFFLLVETDFFEKYHDYFVSIQRQEGLAALERRRRGIVESLRFSLKRVATVQGIVTVLAILVAPWIVLVFRMDPMHLSVLRLGMYSAFIQAGAVILMNILLYFDHQGEALKISAVFCLLNAVCTEATLRMGLLAYGYGYGIAALVSLAMALWYANERLRLLHFWTFVRQPFHEPVAQSTDADAELS
ncbi:MAG: exopolysaccharide Pel transporter PelG [Elusimicrobia bacterium]|nr:exopolysaccharide Pel transporter PelG [Elusimicrobiota bacterium]